MTPIFNLGWFLGRLELSITAYLINRTNLIRIGSVKWVNILVSMPSALLYINVLGGGGSLVKLTEKGLLILCEREGLGQHFMSRHEGQ